MPVRPRVFISHTTHDERDRSIARRLATGLEADGVEVWIAPRSIPPGDIWRQELIRQILDQSSHFLVVLSAAAVSADWVLTEIELASERHRADPGFRILPLVTGRLGEYPGQTFINRFQRVPYHEDFAGQLAEVRRALGVSGSTPPDVADLIADKTDGFVGRGYVFDAIDRFIAANDRGFFRLEGDPGAGKTTILAEYVRRTGCIAHFNIRSQGINTSRQFVRSIGTQLSARYGIAAAAPSTDAEHHGEVLARLLTEAKAAGDGSPVVLAVDGLDEVDRSTDPPGANVLLLPQSPPSGVYFVLSNRRADVPLLTDAPSEVYDLADHRSATMADVRTYLIQMGSRQRLRDWLADRDIALSTFVDALSSKSEGNFMYLRYVLPELTEGSYQKLDIRELPQGLEQYYESHWRLMGMAALPSSRMKVWVIYLLCEFKRPVSSAVLTSAVRSIEPGADALAVQDVLSEWRQFLHRDETVDGPRFSLYHTSFRDFLHRKDTVKSAGLSLQGVNGVIGDLLWEHEYEQG